MNTKKILLIALSFVILFPLTMALALNHNFKKNLSFKNRSNIIKTFKTRYKKEHKEIKEYCEKFSTLGHGMFHTSSGGRYGGSVTISKERIKKECLDKKIIETYLEKDFSDLTREYYFIESSPFFSFVFLYYKK